MPKLLCALLSFLVFIPALSAESTPHWYEARSDHFTVITDSNEKEALHLLDQFERMRELFHKVLPSAASDAPSPIIVFALKDRKSFETMEPAEYLKKNALTLGGYFQRTQDQNYILIRLDNSEEQHPFATVYHEYTHFVLRKAEYIPLWLGEGLAEFYQNTDIKDKDVVLGQPSSNDILYLRQERLLPLPVIFAVDHSSPYYHDENKGSVFYAESWALTHMIEVEDFKTKTSRLADYAKLLKNGGDPVASAQQVFGDLKLLQKHLDSYVSQSSYSAFRLNAPVTVDATTFKAVPITTNDANALRADVLTAIGRTTDARALIDAVLASDPNNALAAEAMGGVCYREHDQSCAGKWYGIAAKSDQGSFLANFFYGMTLFHDGDRGKDAEIEASLRKAIKLNPQFAPSYDVLANFYASRDEKLDDAYTLLLAAVTIEPESVPYRLNAVNIQLQRKQYENALRSLATAEKIAKTPEDKAMVASRIKMVEQFKQYQSGGNEGDTIVVGSEQPGTKATYNDKDQVIVLKTHDAEDEGPKFPTVDANAAHHTASGVIHHVKCSYPTSLVFTVDAPGKSVKVFTTNFFKIPFTTLNFQPDKDLDVCSMIDGMKSKVDYIAVSDKEYAGQVSSVEISK